MLTYQQTPIQEIHDPLFDNAGVQLLVKREDLNHPIVSGNKWWKLKYNLQKAIDEEQTTLLTFGGAYSNHIYATAGAAKELQLKSIGLIRGEGTLPLNPTLEFATQAGMQLHYLDRQSYREKHTASFIESLVQRFGEFYLIPEGGTNSLALKGTQEWGEQLKFIPFDYLYLPVGTGGTIAGLIKAMPHRNVLGVSTLKGDFLTKEIQGWLDLEKNSDISYGNWNVLTSYHHGGYAKATPALMNFIQYMQEKHSLPLDPVYTGKMLWAIFEDVRLGKVTRGSVILAVHTGGLQGVSTSLKHT